MDAAGCERFFNFFREHTLDADPGEGYVGDLIAGGVDDFDFNFEAAGTEERGNMVGLPERELGTAGADAQSGH